MKPGRASRTAELVCLGRAIAHCTSPIAEFSDPTAYELLPAWARSRVERLRAGTPPSGLRERIWRGYMNRQSTVMIARTVEIDRVIRDAAAPQLVVLGAGLDGRAWRMDALHDAVVFEVDHPDTQRAKRERAGVLTLRAREVRFVPVDFTRDSLDVGLDAAGHDVPSITTWVWEGVVMYLTRAEIEASLRVIARRSAHGSRVVIVYHRMALQRFAIALAVRWLGEPFRSHFTVDAMRALLATHGFAVTRDVSIPEIATGLSPALGKKARFLSHLRIVTAERDLTLG
jgi:methyltransferase (TIGR00027 family)